MPGGIGSKTTGRGGGTFRPKIYQVRNRRGSPLHPCHNCGRPRFVAIEVRKVPLCGNCAQEMDELERLRAEGA